MDYEINLYNELNSNIKKDWKNLELNSSNYCFQGYDWFENWVSIYRNKNNYIKLCIVVIKKNNEAICIFPFEIKKIFNLEILQWSGGKQADYCSPILSNDINFNEEVFKNIFKEVLKKLKDIDLIYFIKQPKYIENKINPFVYFLKNYEDSKTFNISLPQKWIFYSDSIKKKKFYIQNKRNKKLLKKLGKLKFKIAKTELEKKKFLDELFLQKNISLSNKNLRDIFKSKDFEFYKFVKEQNSKSLQIHLSALFLNDELITIHWGTIYKNRFYYLLLSMKENNLKKYSPGRLLLSLLIRWSISKKLNVFDFTLGEENYKKGWSNNSSYLSSHVSFLSPKGFLLFLIIKIKIFLKIFVKNNYFRKFFSTFTKLFTK